MLESSVGRLANLFRRNRRSNAHLLQYSPTLNLGGRGVTTKNMTCVFNLLANLFPSSVDQQFRRNKFASRKGGCAGPTKINHKLNKLRSSTGALWCASIFRVCRQYIQKIGLDFLRIWFMLLCVCFGPGWVCFGLSFARCGFPWVCSDCRPVAVMCATPM
jgi:hypothetical protein